MPKLHEYVTGPLRDAVIGEDPFATEHIWEKLFNLTPNMNDKQAAMRAMAAVDIGVWDIVGRALKVRVRILLGGYRDRLPVIRFAYYVAGRNTETMIEDLVVQRQLGIHGVKLKVGAVSVTEDIERVRAIRQSMGGDYIIVCDANQAWTVEEALQFARGVEPFNLAWLEEPVRWHYDLEKALRVRRGIRIPIAVGQGENSRWGCWRLVEGEAVDVLNVAAAASV